MTSVHVAHLILSHLLSIVGFAMGAVLMAQILVSRRPTGSTYAWLLAIVLMPYVGVPLYLVFGGRKIKRQAALKHQLYASAPIAAHADATIVRMLCAMGSPPVRRGNQVTLLGNGEQAFRALIDLIQSAEHSIHVSTLILADDEVGREIMDRLEQKARAGVEVRLLIDALWKWRTNKQQIASFRRAGGKVAWFMPVWHTPFRGHANLRLHRKIVLVDGRSVILGGMNLASEYMGPTPLPERWRDLSAVISGPAVDDIDAVFAADWRFASGETLALKPAATVAGDAAIQVVGSGPDVASDLIYDAFLSAIFEARQRLWVATPYFVPDEALSRAFVLAARRGVDVRVLLPARSNHLTADLAGASYLRQLLDAGGRIACFKPGMMHAKVVIVDGSLGVLGSANMDMRSLFLDYEIAMFFSTRAEIEGLVRWYESLLPSCVGLPPAGRGRVLVEGVARLLAPLE